MAVFDINSKVALVTGGLSGIGLTYAQELLKNGAKGVTLVDLNEKASDKVVKELEEEFGKNKVIFVKADVRDIEEFEDAFKRTVATFGNVDILINNAGIFDESDEGWRKTVQIGVLNGILLGLEKYLCDHKSGEEGLIVNTSSIAGLEPYPYSPIYVATKFAIHGATISFGHPVHYERQHVRVVAVCPGVTTSPLTSTYRYGEYKKAYLNRPRQTLADLAPELVRVIQRAPTGTAWVLDSEPAYQFVLPDRDSIPKIYL
ncbi:15-hydroxyprostaglandin dehydrogenase [NAD(+)]-like isoform X2 [Anthonomus grandis grandis]|uniref:15-hydroxyprostaglandin dehydrogenase [NAD(+)]-like isoform X2 n=1 Tax=Anthonomus grandis grandis TaxID=2921223 RepID=UPI002166B25C|nr:15-hydroxyprostaglandin dehydrogenase [NAD(+)]-like isoform X2 [Anthonomus grandis grandis]